MFLINILHTKGSLNCFGFKSHGLLKKSFLLRACFTFVAVLFGVSTFADLSDIPLSLGVQAKPNGMFLIDDSGSMNWEILLNDGTNNPGGCNACDTREDGQLDFTPGRDRQAFLLCPGYNTLAFDPDGTYKPWKGKDKDGNDFKAITKLSDVNDGPLVDPFLGSSDSNNRVDISNHVFFLWNDSNEDRRYSSNECPLLPTKTEPYDRWSCSGGLGLSTDTQCEPELIPGHIENEVWVPERSEDVCETTETWDVPPSCLSIPDTRDVADLDQCVGSVAGAESNGIGCVGLAKLDSSLASDELREKYANWYTYYRKREYVAIAAMSNIIDSTSNISLGLATLHNNIDPDAGVVSPPTVITDMDELVNGEAVNKATLLQNLASIYSDHGTPFAHRLDLAGDYFFTGNGRLFETHGAPAAPGQSPKDFSAPGSVTSPIDKDCKQNFTIAMTDGFTNGNSYGNEYPQTSDEDGDGVKIWNDLNQNEDVDSSELKPTTADVAAFYYNTDLSTLPDNVPGLAKHQHMNTFVVAFGINGTLTCTECGSADWLSNTNIADNTAGTIDDLRRAASNGGGKFVSASSPEDLKSALSEVFKAAYGDVSAGAAVSSNTGELVEGAVVYKASFNSLDWEGEIQAIPLSSGETENRPECLVAGVAPDVGELCATALWSAADELAARSYSNRKIITTNAGEGIDFLWPSNYQTLSATTLSATQVNNLLANAPAGDEQAYGEKLVAYLRGDDTYEVDDSKDPAKIFRSRPNTPLGDIVNAGVVYHNGVVYAGANDGMLHAFNVVDPEFGLGAVEGEEIFAYIPNAVFAGLDDLAGPNYNHKYYVDGTPTIGQVPISNTDSTILVAGLNKGGKSVYALDITNPYASADKLALWEYSHGDLGYTYSRPDIVQLENETWAVIFGNGYGASGDGQDGDDGESALFILDAATGGDGFTRKIATGDDTILNGISNGLSTVTPVDRDGNGFVDLVYGGDLAGNLWRFDLISTNSANWSKSLIFSTESPGGYSQPITTRPSVAFHPNGDPGLIVYFGTGSYVFNGDNQIVNQTTQSFYGVVDDLTNAPTVTRASLLQQTILQEVLTAAEETVTELNETVLTGGVLTRVTSNNDITWGSPTNHKGWYMDLVNTDQGNTDNRGERQITNSFFLGNKIVFSTALPSENECSFGGSSFLMALDFADGSSFDSAVFDVNNDNVITDDDLTTIDGFVVTGVSITGIPGNSDIVNVGPLSNKVFGTTTDGSIYGQNMMSSMLSKPRRSWSELIQ